MPAACRSSSPSPKVQVRLERGVEVDGAGSVTVEGAAGGGAAGHGSVRRALVLTEGVSTVTEEFDNLGFRSASAVHGLEGWCQNINKPAEPVG